MSFFFFFFFLIQTYLSYIKTKVGITFLKKKKTSFFSAENRLAAGRVNKKTILSISAERFPLRD